jgi:hypothetical protein
VTCAIIAHLRLISSGTHALTRSRLKCILIGDAMTEPHDLRISILRADASRLFLSHIVYGFVMMTHSMDLKIEPDYKTGGDKFYGKL